jgi:hypothetical protein
MLRQLRRLAPLWGQRILPTMWTKMNPGLTPVRDFTLANLASARGEPGEEHVSSSLRNRICRNGRSSRARACSAPAEHRPSPPCEGLPRPPDPRGHMLGSLARSRRRGSRGVDAPSHAREPECAPAFHRRGRKSVDTLATGLFTRAHGAACVRAATIKHSRAVSLEVQEPPTHTRQGRSSRACGTVEAEDRSAIPDRHARLNGHGTAARNHLEFNVTPRAGRPLVRVLRELGCWRRSRMRA